MTAQDFLHLIPLIVISTAPIIIMLTLTVARNFRIVHSFSILMFILSFISLFLIFPGKPYQTGTLLVFDNLSGFFLSAILGSGIMITLISGEYFKNFSAHREEYFIILFVAILGAAVLSTANHFISFFLGLETLSISLYILIAYVRNRDYSIEASIKFLVVASIASSFLLFGMALIYAATGTMSFATLAYSFQKTQDVALLLTGVGMMITGIGFKMALVPFHMWAADVYQGSPAPVTATIATVSKASIFAVFIRFFAAFNSIPGTTIITTLTVISVISMFIGNFLALKQTNLKRLLAYSSIAHMGYLMIALISGSNSGIQAAVFYLIAYMITTIGAFGVISLLSGCENETESISDLEGLYYKNPWLAIVLSFIMLSLAGIPLTAGFIAKFYLLLEGIRGSLWILVSSLIINTAISIYYYLRVIKTLFSPSVNTFQYKLSSAGHLILALVLAGIALLGILPGWLSDALSIFLAAK